MTEVRIKSNFDVHSFDISDEDMQKLDGLNEDKPTGWDPTIEPL